MRLGKNTPLLYHVTPEESTRRTDNGLRKAPGNDMVYLSLFFFPTSMDTVSTPENQPEIPKAYDPAEWEDRLYALWEESGYFNPDRLIEDGIIAADAPVFSMILPPPNVTGHLHVGHSTMLAIQDVLTRFHRMRGYRALWLPGTDHAAIATQSKVENIIHKEEGKTRHDFPRGEFLRRVEEFARSSHDTIVKQTKKMGSSLDWSREAYTLDDARNRAVRTAFKKMYDDGIIYRGYRTVNWSSKGQSTCSDDEVVHTERQSKLYTFRYWKDFPIEIATTRPETKLGDTAVAVHPDGKWKHLVGQVFEGQFCGVRLRIPIVADTMVDPEFGTGAVGITPAHSHTDYDFWQRHQDTVTFGEPVIGKDGRMTRSAGAEFQGLTIDEARTKIIERLRADDMIREEDIKQSIGISDRYGDIIETLPLLQWFIGVNREFEHNGQKTTLKTLMQDAVRPDGINIIPDRFGKIYFHWIDNLRDWCISRQIWYGHQIPVWYRDKEIFCGIEGPEGSGWEQDPDTLDTWFSSGLWTFSTLGWASNDAQWEREKMYHPTTVLETGYDILFFWVARMILMSTYFLNEVPFRNVYLHGLVRDEQGRKMSKSLGNVLDPLDIIPEYGADALRLALIIGSTPGNDIRIGNEKIASTRNFTNKLWNIGRYVLSGNQRSTISSGPEPKTAADHWILAQLQTTVGSVTEHLEKYEFSLAGEVLRDFTWNDFADWYVEIHKIERNDALLRYVFETILKLWHPFMPFVTEALWEKLCPHEQADFRRMLFVQRYPEAKDIPKSDPYMIGLFGETKMLIQGVRAARSFYRIEPKTLLKISLLPTKNPEYEYVRVIVKPEDILENKGLIQKLSRIENLELLPEDSSIPEGTITIATPSFQVFVHLEEVIDITAERARLTKEITECEGYVTRTEARLANPQFTAKAPAKLVEDTQAQLETSRQKLALFKDHLSQLGTGD